jgi:hypothetical protein
VGARPYGDASRDDPDYFALKIMLEWAAEKPIKPFALAKAAIAHERKLYRRGALLERSGFWERDVVKFRGALLCLEEQVQDTDEKTIDGWGQIDRVLAREPIDDASPYRYGDDLIHIKRLGNKFHDLLAYAEFLLFLRDFPDGGTDDAAGYCRTDEEKRQEALRIIERLCDEQFERHAALVAEYDPEFFALFKELLFLESIVRLRSPPTWT